MREIPCVYCEVRTNPSRVYIKFMLEMVSGEYNNYNLQEYNIYVSQSCNSATGSGDGCDDPMRRRI